jgi:hypothetical protein
LLFLNSFDFRLPIEAIFLLLGLAALTLRAQSEITGHGAQHGAVCESKKNIHTK